MSSKQCWSIIAGLILLNIVTVLYFTVGENSMKEDATEIVAAVGDEEISRPDWLAELERIHGKDVLTTMVNEEVILQLAAKHQLTVSEDEMKVEAVLRQALYGFTGNSPAHISDKELKKKLEVSILLEKLLTKDAVITDKEVESYYKSNESLLKFTDLYRLSHIVLSEKAKANAIIKELKMETDFAAMAIERSEDKYTANNGGELGYISLDSESVPEEYKEIAASLKPGEWSQPIKIKDGYAILYLRDQIGKSELSFGKIKSTLKRKTAMEQMNIPVSADMLWEQYDVDWIYGK